MPTTKHWTTEPDGEVNIKTTLSGPASIAPCTVIEAFKKIVRSYPSSDALCVKREGSWKIWSYSQYYNDVCRVAKSMYKIGLDERHGVCLLGFNSPEWFISYLAAIMAGGIATGIYTTNNADACHFIAEDSAAQIFLAENNLQLDKIVQVKDRLPKLKAIVQYLPGPVSEEHKAAGVLSWDEFIDLGKDIPDYEVSWRIEAQKPGQCASLIYTSGTTGPPKGVMLSHDNLTWTAAICSHVYNLTKDDRFISYLPLSHVAAQMMDIHAPLQKGFSVWFAQPDAMKGTLQTTLKEVKPTVFFGVPRVWEKLKEKIEEGLLEAKGMKEWMVKSSRAIGRKASINKVSGIDLPWGYWLANTFVFKSLREKLGLENCRLCASGAAPLPKNVIDFFMEFDIPILVIYGMSESTGPQTMNTSEHHKPGSAGVLIPGAELKLVNTGPNGDGEICYRGRHVFMGYLRQEQKTSQCIDEDGWLHSGDIGRKDSDDFYHITGRIKELLITRGGENVAPVPIEEGMLAEMKLLSHCMVIGDEQRYLTMFVTLKCQMTEDQKPKDDLSLIALSTLRELRSKATTVSEAMDDSSVEKYIERGMKRVNEKSISRAARVQKFCILPVDFSISGGELTPTMKLKRKVVLEKYHHLVTAMYAET